MELQNLLAVTPKDYLRNGFFASDGQVREGINGQCSLAMAYRLREDGLVVEDLQRIVDKLDGLTSGERRFAPNGPLGEAIVSELRDLWNSDVVGRSAALAELSEALRPLVTDWKNFAAAAVHIQRIMAQLALLTAVRGAAEAGA